ncbi:nuclear transport factor 2 family protein [Aureivirga marina]|uniref:nuclear transport factor 2 family protein n=1 Tax=Aureivirga marina TaxID=1182451 RepID=UPI0018CAC660|nr:ester cyclase [Aureivirga marina]
MSISNKQKPQIVFENFTQEHWTKQESENVKMVVDFFQKLMNEHDFDYIQKKYGQGSYIQHNRAIPNGISGLINYIKDLVKRFPEYSYDLKKVYVDKDFVIFHSHVTMKAKHRGNEKKGFIITDTFRLENGKLAEHWDAMQPIDFFSRWLFLLIGGAIRNNNPTF